MNKEDNFKEKFKQALISTVRVISNDYQIYNNKKGKLNEQSLNIANLENIKDKNEFLKLRADSDSEALKRKFSNKKIFEKNIPTKPSCRSLYNLSERIRYELLGTKMLKGISQNFYENYRNKLNKAKNHNIEKKEDVDISEAFELYMLNKFFKINLDQSNKKILNFWEKDFDNSFNKHISYLNQNLENQEAYNVKFSEILQNMGIFESENDEETKETEQDNEQNNNNSDNNELNDSDNIDQGSDDDNEGEGANSIDDLNEFRLDEQMSEDEVENQKYENIIQKKNLSINDKDYKIFTTEFDEVAKAETLDNIEEISKLRKNLDQQLLSFQDLIIKLANKLQRQLLAKMSRSWEFD